MGASQARESRYLGREFNQRMASQQSFSMGNFPGAVGHAAMADRFGGMADRMHSRRMGRQAGMGMQMGPQMGGMGGMGAVPYGPTIGGGPTMGGGMGRGLSSSASVPTGLSLVPSAGVPGAVCGGGSLGYPPGATVAASGWNGMNGLGGMGVVPYEAQNGQAMLMYDGYSNGFSNGFSSEPSLPNNYVAPTVFDIGLSPYNGLESVAGNCSGPPQMQQQPLMLVPICNPNPVNPCNSQRCLSVVPNPEQLQLQVHPASEIAAQRRLSVGPHQHEQQRRMSILSTQPEPPVHVHLICAPKQQPTPITPTPLVLQHATNSTSFESIKPTPLNIDEIQAPSVGTREPPLAETRGSTKVVSTW